MLFHSEKITHLVVLHRSNSFFGSPCHLSQESTARSQIYFEKLDDNLEPTGSALKFSAYLENSKIC